MDRRNFLRTGSLAMLGSLAVPSLAMPASVRGALGGADNQSAVASAMVHFGVTEADLKKVMAAALEKGGDYADLYFEHTFNNSVVLMDGKVNNCGANIDFGMGVRVLAGDQTGYAYVEGGNYGRNAACCTYCCPYRLFGQGRKICRTDGKDNYQKPLCRH